MLAWILFIVALAILAALPLLIPEKREPAAQCDADTDYDCIDGTKRSFPVETDEERERAIAAAQWQWMS